MIARTGQTIPGRYRVRRASPRTRAKAASADAIATTYGAFVAHRWIGRMAADVAPADEKR